jgi:hypothetical protein
MSSEFTYTVVRAERYRQIYPMGLAKSTRVEARTAPQREQAERERTRQQEEKRQEELRVWLQDDGKCRAENKRRMETVTILMTRGANRRSASVPAKTDEREMVQLLVSKLGEGMRQRWRVSVRNFVSCDQAPFKLCDGGSHELAELEAPAAPPAPVKVTANTRLGALREDIELNTSWTERQVHEAI